MKITVTHQGDLPTHNTVADMRPGDVAYPTANPRFAFIAVDDPSGEYPALVIGFGPTNRPYTVADRGIAIVMRHSGSVELVLEIE